MSDHNDGAFDPKQDEDRAEELVPRSQKPLAVRSEDYIETGYLAVGLAEDGGVKMGGEAPPGPAPGLTPENMVCLESDSRPYCEHYIAFLTDAEGTANEWRTNLIEALRSGPRRSQEPTPRAPTQGAPTGPGGFLPFGR